MTSGIAFLYGYTWGKTTTQSIVCVHGSVHRESMSIIAQQVTTIYSFIIFSADSSTCFGWYPHPSSWAHL